MGKLQCYRTLGFWGGGSAYVVWEGGGWSGGDGWSGVGDVNDSGADLDIFRLLAVYVSLLDNISVLYHIYCQKSSEIKETSDRSQLT